jgi:hypothetical protein
MMKDIFLATLILFSLGCQGSTCLITEESIVKNSEKYSNFIEIKTTNNDGLITVIVEAPTSLDGMVLQNIFLYKKAKSEIENALEVPLKVISENGKSHSWYSIGNNMIDENFIALDYGDDCGMSIRYKVN